MSVALATMAAASATNAGAATLATVDGAANNAQRGLFFDVLVGGKDIVLTSFDTYIQQGTGNFSFYLRSGTFAGHETSSTGWTLVGAADLTAATVQTLVNFNPADVTLNAGQRYGLYLVSTNNTRNIRYYGNSNANRATGTVAASNTDLTLYAGRAKAGGPFASDGLINDRTFVGAINYTVAAVPEPAGWAMMIVGMGAVGYAARRRRAVPARG